MRSHFRIRTTAPSLVSGRSLRSEQSIFSVLTILVLTCFTLQVSDTGFGEEFPPPIGKFLETHCRSCHSGDQPEAGFDVQSLHSDIGHLADTNTFAR